MNLFLLAALVSSASCNGPAGRAGADDSVRPLFEDARSAWVVVIPDDAPRPVRYAADEFTDTVRKISGATIGVVSRSEAPKRNVVRLVTDGDEMKDVFSVTCAPGEIELKGNSPRGTLFAVYAFLRDRLGARWYWPGKSGEFLPKLSRYKVGRWHKTYKPFFDSREMSICSIWRNRHPETERWFPKVFLNYGGRSDVTKEDIGFVRRVSGHAVTLPLETDRRQKLFREHPEWFSLLNGKRDIKGIAGCWSSPGFFDYTVSNLVADIRAKRAVLANYFVADVVPRCECGGCTADPDKSARWWNYYAKLIDAIRREVPDVRFAGLAYQEYRPVPGIKVKNLEHVEYCQYNRCYYHGLEDPRCPMNARSMEEFRRWNNQAPLALYGYEFDVFNQAMYLPMWRVFADEMRLFKQMDLKRVKTEYSVNINRLEKKNPPPRSQIGQLASRLSYYAWAMSAFDPDLDMGALLDDFCSHVYGGGAAEMRAYHDMMAEAWDAMKTHITYFSNPARVAAPGLITPEIEKAGRARLEAAARAAKGDARALGEVRLDAECFANWVKLAADARAGGTVYDLKLIRDDDAFNVVAWLTGRTKKGGRAQKTGFKVYRAPNALRVLAECMEENPAIDRGTTENDRHNWGCASIEFFIDTGDGVSRQIAVTPAGGVWDSANGDIKWSSGAKVRPAFERDRWTLDISIPYEALGTVPKTGDRWKIMIIRNPSDAKYKACGWPIAAHRDYSSAATLVFK